jgi:murein L,D-transpeptidase YcbB/YkuD
MLRAYKDNREALKMKVVVGREYTDHATPLFSDVMEKVIFRPYWNIPPKIAADEVVPDTRKDWASFAKNNYQIVDHYGPDAKVYPLDSENLTKVEQGKLLVQQKPGPENSLGLVKFLFPNKYAIYLHDTPAKHLFAMQRRDYSHGCIRVEKPLDLALYVLSQEPGNWSVDKIKNAMLHGDQNEIDLTHKIPVYIRYWTTYVDDDGTVQFRKDIYNKMIKVSEL